VGIEREDRVHERWGVLGREWSPLWKAWAVVGRQKRAHEQ
jgi:hypothetical protein